MLQKMLAAHKRKNVIGLLWLQPPPPPPNLITTNHIHNVYVVHVCTVGLPHTVYYRCDLLSGNPLDQGKFSLLAESINIGNNNNKNNYVSIRGRPTSRFPPDVRANGHMTGTVL